MPNDPAIAEAATPSFAFIIPARNEESHIADTLRSALEQSLPPLEVIVVDDGSDDTTPEVVESIASRSCVQLLRNPRSLGAGAARNTAIDQARADIVVFLDADDSVPADFLARLCGRYTSGADAVAVESRVADQTTAIGRFQQAFHSYHAARSKDVGYSHAFSCRRDAAVSVRFSEIPGCGGEDGAFVVDLRAAGFSCVKAQDIMVEFSTAVTLGELWEHSRKRGRAAARVDRLLARRSRLATIGRRGAAAVRAIVTIAVVIPLGAQALRYAQRSPRRYRDLARFWLLTHVEILGRTLGGLSGALRPTDH